MRIALAQINPTVGDIAGNARKIADAIERARRDAAELVVLPELAIIGYPPKDLLLKPAVLDACAAAVQELASRCTDIAAIIGYPDRAQGKRGRSLYNAAAYCKDGRVVHRHVKSLLPTYDVFDEQRYFEPGPRVDITELGGVKLGVSICEDMWNDEETFSRQLYHDNPIHELAAKGAELFINTAASPFVVRKQQFRHKLMSHVAKKHGLPLVYCSQVGGNDELIFDGNSCVFDARGNVIAQARAFEEDLVVCDVPLGRETAAGDANGEAEAAGQARCNRGPAAFLEPVEEAYHALVLGIRDYCRKCGFDSIVLGLSGGIDSAVTCALVVAAMGADKVTGLTMPSRYSSAGSRDDSKRLSESLGVTLHEVPIEDPHKAFERLLEPIFAGLEPDASEENIQARCRGVLLMAMSNKFGSLLVTTGNKSEMAVGYCTLYGDMAGGLAVLSDVPKTMVYDLARWINDSPRSPLRQRYGKPVIPESTITKPPSAELKPDQVDQDTLPDYDVLDEIIERYVEREQSVRDIVNETSFDAEMVEKIARLIDRNEYKRKQTPPGLKITGRAFGFGRRMPIAQRWNEARAGLRADSDEVVVGVQS
ncbi:MAG: NAD+ synthase [Phycisphaeraceae bacterium]